MGPETKEGCGLCLFALFALFVIGMALKLALSPIGQYVIMAN